MSQLVSILIPAYNAEKWIKETINSALAQTWPRKEIIIIDDGSTDKTLEAAKQFESGSLKVISQENKGASAARNKAYSFAQGDYIQWLDADDLLAPNKISEQMKVADSGQTSLTLISSTYGIFHWRQCKARFVPTSLWQDLTPVEYLVKEFSENIWMHPSIWLVSRRLTKIAGPWNERLSLNDDGEYFCRIVAASERIRFVREGRCYYRKTSFNQLSLSSSESSSKSKLLSWKYCIGYLRSLEESERTRDACLTLLQTLLPYFYLQKTELPAEIKEINKIALELGGRLKVPSFGWKYNLMMRLFGRDVSYKIRTTLRKLRLSMDVRWDEMLYRITQSPIEGSNSFSILHPVKKNSKGSDNSIAKIK